MKNISDRLALAFLKWGEACIYFMPIIPVVVLVYGGRGVSVGEFFLIQGIFRIVAFLFEIPSGYLSDVFSRRKILIIGACVQFASLFLLMFSHGFWAIMLCEAGLGLASALFSGTKEAYAFDLLKRMGREHQYLRENGSIQTFSQISTFVAVLVGGVLLAMGEYVLLGVEAAFALVAVGMFWMLPELAEVRRKVAPESSPLRDCLSIVKMSVKHPEIKWLMIFPAMYGGFTIILFWILQPVMTAGLVPVALFGLFLGINQAARATFSATAHRIKKFFGARRLLWLCLGLVAAAFAAAIGAVHMAGNLGVVLAICAFVAIVPASQAMCGLVFKDYIHHKIESRERGTVLSVYSMFNMGISGLMLILAQPVLDNFGVVVTMLACLGFMVVILFPLRKVFAIKGIEDEAK